MNNLVDRKGFEYHPGSTHKVFYDVGKTETHDDRTIIDYSEVNMSENHDEYLKYTANFTNQLLSTQTTIYREHDEFTFIECLEQITAFNVFPNDICICT
eukprot:UN00780